MEPPGVSLSSPTFVRRACLAAMLTIVAACQAPAATSSPAASGGPAVTEPPGGTTPPSVDATGSPTTGLGGLGRAFPAG